MDDDVFLLDSAVMDDCIAAASRADEDLLILVASARRLSRRGRPEADFDRLLFSFRVFVFDLLRFSVVALFLLERGLSLSGFFAGFDCLGGAGFVEIIFSRDGGLTMDVLRVSLAGGSSLMGAEWSGASRLPIYGNFVIWDLLLLLVAGEKDFFDEGDFDCDKRFFFGDVVGDFILSFGDGVGDLLFSSFIPGKPFV